MALLSNADRVAIGKFFQELLSLRRESLGAVTKADVQAAIAAADDWIEANKASYNAALPQPARGVLSAAQKAEILVYVVKRRYEAGA